MPSQVAPAAPGKPMTATVWPAKDCREGLPASTMKYPTAPATTATMVPARSALSMK
jgi:hypothetical protein